MLDEVRRQAYLQAMGVDQYVPRSILQGARPLNRCEYQACIQEHSLNAVEDSVVSATSVALKSSPIKHDPDAIEQPLVDESQPFASKPNQPTLPIVEPFHLAVITIQNRLLILDECPRLISDSHEYRQLLQNILRALGLTFDRLNVQSFQWPVVKGTRADHSEQAVREALRAYIYRRLKQANVHQLLLMGDKPANYVLDAWVSDEWPAIRTLSASRMLTEPEHKRKLWQQLQPLVRILTP